MIARILVLAALAALVAAVVQWRAVVQAPAGPQAPPQRPGYYLTGVDLQEFGEDGRLRIGLQSISAQEDPASGTVRLSDVEVDYHAPGGRKWVLTAEEARVPPGGRVVEFEGDVRLSGAPGPGPESAELSTRRLSLDTVAEVATTQSPVQFAYGSHRLSATGMRADLESGRLHLESGVDGLFTP